MKRISFLIVIILMSCNLAFAESDNVEVQSLVDTVSLFDELKGMMWGIIVQVWPVGLAVLMAVLGKEYLLGMLERQKQVDKQLQRSEVQAEVKRIQRERAERRFIFQGHVNDDLMIDPHNDATDGGNVQRHVIWEPEIQKVEPVSKDYMIAWEYGNLESDKAWGNEVDYDAYFKRLKKQEDIEFVDLEFDWKQESPDLPEGVTMTRREHFLAPPRCNRLSSGLDEDDGGGY